MMALLLSGCSFRETFETISDIDAAPVLSKGNELQLSLPDEASIATVAAADGSKIYLCDGYTVTVQTFDAGDLDRTLRETTGFGIDQLQVIMTQAHGVKRYECVWAAAGEGEDQVGRAVILDDGVFHYVVTAMAGSAKAGSLQTTWEHILQSATLVSTG